jgi:superfamily II DNA or RNA helicase
MNCKRVYGLSATPNRSDGNDDIIKWHLGDVVYFPPEIGELLKPIVYMIKFPFQIFSKNKSYLTWGGKFNLSRYHKQMIKSDNYFKNVNELLKKLYGQNRNILVLGTRKNSLLRLAKDISLNKDQIGFFVPTSTKNDRLSVSDTFNLKESFSTKRIVFSTYSACRDGNNRKDLDCLIMSTPTTNIDQAIGRILRILSDKKTPIVIDLIDTEGPIVTTKDGKKVPWFIRNSLTRKEKYIKNGWIIKEINLQLENQ